MIYFCHGVPGGPEDASLLGIEGVAAPDLFAAAPLAQFDAATAGAPDGSVHLIRFSIGAMVALRLAASRPDKVGKVTLISPAAPLNLGDFLPAMAGKPVFRMAKRLPSLLRFVTGLQGLVVKIAPDFMLDRLFAKAEPHERRLVSEPEVRKALRAGLRNSMVNTQRPMCRQSVPTWVTGRGPCKWSPALLKSGMARRTVGRRLQCLRLWCRICQRARNCAVSRAQGIMGR